MPPEKPLNVWIVMFPDVQELDVTGPLEIFALTNRLSPGLAPCYKISVLAPSTRPSLTRPCPGSQPPGNTGITGSFSKAHRATATRQAA